MRERYPGPGKRATLWPLLTLAALLAPTACQTGSGSADGGPDTVPGLQGCWELEMTAEGPRRDSIRSWLPAGEFPSIVELDLERSEQAEDGWYAAYSWFDGRRQTRPFSAWRPFGQDSILVQRAGALGGMMLRLTPSDDRLLGSLVSFSDVRTLDGEPSQRQAPVRGTATACP